MSTRGQTSQVCYYRATRRDGSPIARPLSSLLSARGRSAAEKPGIALVGTPKRLSPGTITVARAQPGRAALFEGGFPIGQLFRREPVSDYESTCTIMLSIVVVK